MNRAPARLWIALATLAMLGLAIAQVSLDALRGTGVLRQPAFLAGLAAVGMVGVLPFVWLLRHRQQTELRLEAAGAFFFGWLRWRPSLAMAGWIACLLVLPAWVASGLLEQAQGLLPRLAVFWLLALLGAAILPYGRERSWAARWAISGLAIGTAFEVSSLLQISSDPFSLGWSEASRYYYASLFFASRLYGEWLPLPILHPTRYLLQAAPFIFPGAPIWVHRLWQSILWLGLTYAGAWALARRLAWRNARWRLWLVLWLGLFFLQGAVYYHLMVPVVLVLLVLDPSRPWRSLAIVLLASIWAGISRVNWIPVPGMLAAALYALERVQPAGEGFVAYWSRPVAWAVSGAAAGLAAQSAYVAWSGHPASDFGTAFSSSLLWYRLGPNPTFPLGVVPAIVLAVFPLALVGAAALRRGEPRVRGWRLAALGVILGMLLLGGLIVSVKIGGGGDLHNFDAFLVLLAVCGTYLVLDDRVRPQAADQGDGLPVAWWQMVLLVGMPMVFLLNAGAPIPSRDPGHEAQVISAIQTAADRAQSEGKPVLFLSERQLVTFGMVHAGSLQPEDEKVTLMEMAMARNEPYLKRFHQAIRAQRYGLIVSEPLVVQTQGSSHAFGEENDAWSEEVAGPVLCAYQPVFTSNAPAVQLLVPRATTSGCPP